MGRKDLKKLLAWKKALNEEFSEKKEETVEEVEETKEGSDDEDDLKDVHKQILELEVISLNYCKFLMSNIIFVD